MSKTLPAAIKSHKCFCRSTNALSLTSHTTHQRSTVWQCEAMYTDWSAGSPSPAWFDCCCSGCFDIFDNGFSSVVLSLCCTRPIPFFVILFHQRLLLSTVISLFFVVSRHWGRWGVFVQKFLFLSYCIIAVGGICQLPFDPPWQLRGIVEATPSIRSGLLERSMLLARTSK